MRIAEMKEPAGTGDDGGAMQALRSARLMGWFVSYSKWCKTVAI